MAEDGHGGCPSNLGQDNSAQEIESREALRDALASEERMVAVGRPPSTSTKSPGKAIQAFGPDHDGAASSTKLIPKANADMGIDMDDPLKSTPVPKKNQLPKILSYLNETQDHSPPRDEGRKHDPQASNYGDDEFYTQIGESSTNKSTGAVRDGITSPFAAELVKTTAVASSSMKSVIQDGPGTEENVNFLGGPSSSTPSPMKTVQDALGSEEHVLAIGQPPSSSTKSRGKAIQVYDQEEHDEAASSTNLIPKGIAVAACLVQMQPDVGPSVQAPAQHHDGGVAAVGGPAHPNASVVASNAAPAFAQHDVNVGNVAVGGGAVPAPAEPNAATLVPAPAQINGGGIAVIAPHLPPAQPNVGGPVPNVPVLVPVPAQINGGGNALIPARPAPAQQNAGGPAPNAAPPVPVLPPNPGFNIIDEVLTNSGIRPLRNPADGDEGKIWDESN